MPNSPEKKRIESLLIGAEETLGGGTSFHACEATMKGIKKRTGKDVQLIEGINVTSPGAAVHVINNHKRGCTYMRI
jgi:intracellular sulfur oxidation DsrE/DsrF family protein